MALTDTEAGLLKDQLEERHYAVARSYLSPEQLAALQRSVKWIGRLSFQERLPEGIIESRRSSANKVRQIMVSPDRMLARVHPAIANYRRELYEDLHRHGIVPEQWDMHGDLYEEVSYVMASRASTEAGFAMHRDDRHMDPGVVAITMTKGSRKTSIVRAEGEYFSRAPRGEPEYQEVLQEGDVLLLDSQKRPWHETRNITSMEPSVTVVFAHRYSRAFIDQTQSS